MNKKVLYVDDEEVNLFLFERMFMESFESVCVNSGFKGLESLEKDPDIAIVVSDMNMPRMTGLEFIEKAREKYKNLTCFILTGYSVTSAMENAMEQGQVTDCMQKPFNRNLILNNVQKYLK